MTFLEDLGVSHVILPAVAHLLGRPAGYVGGLRAFVGGTTTGGVLVGMIWCQWMDFWNVCWNKQDFEVPLVLFIENGNMKCIKS